MTEPTQAMVDFVRKRRSQDREELFDDFCDSFYLDGDDKDRVVFQDALSKSTSQPNNANPRRGDNRPQRTTGNARRYHPEGDNLAKAPYRFVTLDERIAEPEPAVATGWSDQNLLDQPLEKAVSADLEVEWTFATPVLIGEADGDIDVPLTIDGKHVIPGSTIRGLLRSTAEILGHARLSQANLHHRYGFRDFTHREHRKAENEANDVFAGWLEYKPTEDDEESNFVISPAGKPAPVDIRGLNKSQSSDAEFRYDWLRTPILKRYLQLGMIRGKSIDFTKTTQIGDEKGVMVVSDRSPTIGGDRQRWVEKLELEDQGQGPGKGEQKKREHLFGEPNGPAVRLTPEQWALFERINSKPSRNKPKPDGNWATLRDTLGIDQKDEARHGRLPVFYVGQLGAKGFEFGLVRMFKRAHSRQVQDALPSSHHLPKADFKPDFVEALFGFVHENIPENAATQLAGRVACGMATCVTDPADIEATDYKNAIEAVMGAARASYAPFYLQGQEKDWSSDTVRIAGRKKYPVRYEDSNVPLKKIETVLKGLVPASERRNREIESRMVFLSPKAGKNLTFKGRIKLHNVTQAELGLILMSLLLGTKTNPETWHLVGRGKTAGAGQCRVTGLSGVVQSIGGKTQEVTWSRKGAIDPLTPYFDALSRHMGEQIPRWPEVPQVDELMAMSIPANWKGKTDRLKYMTLKDHGRLKEIVKAHIRHDPPNDIERNHRTLPGQSK